MRPTSHRTQAHSSLRILSIMIFAATLPIVSPAHAQQGPARAIAFPESLILDPMPHNNVRRIETEFRGINDKGIAVGTVHVDGLGNSIRHAIVYNAGKFTVLDGPLPNAPSTRGIAINNRGQVLVGQEAPDGVHYFLFDLTARTIRPVSSDGSVTVAGVAHPFRFTEITGMNDQGEIVGFIANAGGAFGMPLVGPAGSLTLPAGVGKFTSIACPTGTSFNKTGGINNHRQVAGTCNGGAIGFVAEPDGRVTTFKAEPSRPPVVFNNGLGINDDGTVVGFSHVNSQYRGWMYKDTQLTFFDNSALSPDGALAPIAINNRGQIAGMINQGRLNYSAFITKLQP